MPVISIATPTFQRHRLLERQHRVVAAQSEQDFEWLILDDGPEPSAYFQKLADPRIRRALDLAIDRNAIARAMPFVRHELGSRVRLRRIPELLVRLDDTAQRGTRVLQLLAELEAGEVPESDAPTAESLPTPAPRGTPEPDARTGSRPRSGPRRTPGGRHPRTGSVRGRPTNRGRS